MRTRILFAAGFLLLAISAVSSNPALAQAAAAQTPESTTAATTTLHVNVNLVVVPVTVRDTKEHLVLNLTKDDFTLEADGKPQTIRYFDRADDTPLTVGLLVDVSGSMRNQLEEERSASSAFLDGMLKPGRDQAFVVQFGHSADLLADITQSVPKLQAALQKIDGGDNDRPSFGNGSSNNGSGNSQDDSQNGSQNGNSNGGGRHGGGGGNSRGASSGGTVLYDAVYLSSDEVLKKAPVAKGAENSGQARKALILLTDGGDRGSKESLPESIEAAQRTDTTIYAIYYKGEEHSGGGGGFPGGHGGGRGGGFPGGGGHGGGFPGGGGGGGGRGGGGGNETHVDGKKILQRMADETGGRVYEVSKKMPLADIYKQIAEELRSQYRLGFSPANNEAGYHKLVVDTPKQKKVILQARDGYYTGDAK